jgi:hypothetical protein
MKIKFKGSIIYILVLFLFSLSYSIDWQAKTAMPTVRSFGGAATINESLYVVGGRNSSGLLSTLEIYDVISNTWSAGSSLPVSIREFGMVFNADCSSRVNRICC